MSHNECFLAFGHRTLVDLLAGRLSYARQDEIKLSDVDPVAERLAKAELAASEPGISRSPETVTLLLNINAIFRDAV